MSRCLHINVRAGGVRCKQRITQISQCDQNIYTRIADLQLQGIYNQKNNSDRLLSIYNQKKITTLLLTISNQKKKSTKQLQRISTQIPSLNLNTSS